MKNLKNYAMAFLALIIAATSLTIMSFKEKSENKISVESTQHFYNSEETDEDAFADPMNWSTNDSSNECEPTGNRPCQISVPDGQTLSQILTGKTNNEVLDLSSGRKP